MTLISRTKVELLTNAQMYAADAAAMDRGVAGITLMEAAGAAIARAIRMRWRPRPALVLCGPGNNGGDGFVVARLLETAGWPVTVAMLGRPSSLSGDARRAHDAWREGRRAAKGAMAPVPLDENCLAGAELVVDALFGAGLDRPLDGAAARVVQAADQRRAARGLPVVAADMPSGVNGDTGAVLGCALAADLTVTFFRGKPGHHLLPGAVLCGELQVADIGIPEAVLDEIGPTLAVNDPVLWRDSLRRPTASDHKYTRGHVLVIAGAMPGAAVLAAWSAARIGAGMVTVGRLVPSGTRARAADPPPVYSHLPAAVITTAFATVEQAVQFRRDRKVQSVVIGPGLGRDSASAGFLKEFLQGCPGCILDADGISAFDSQPNDLAETIGTDSVLTPHSGEFSRILPPDAPDDGAGKLEATAAAAAFHGATIVHKGFDTVVAAPAGRAVINGNAIPALATAGAGDVLAGIIAGLKAQGMPAFEAAAAGVWIHAEAARLATGDSDRPDHSILVADDLPAMLPGARARALAGASA